MLRRLLLALALIALPAQSLAQSVTTSTGEPSRPAVVKVPSTGRSYPSNDGTDAQAYGMVLLNPTTGAPYVAGGGGGGASGANGSAAPTSSNATGFTNSAGNQTAVGPTTPLPVTSAAVDSFPMAFSGVTGGSVANDDTITATGAGGAYFDTARGPNGEIVSAASFDFFASSASSIGFYGASASSFTSGTATQVEYWNPSSASTNIFNGVQSVPANYPVVGNTSGRYLYVSWGAAGTYKIAGHPQRVQRLGGGTVTVSGTIIAVPTTGSTTSTAGTITTGGTYQSVLAANAGRKGCLVINKSTTDPMFVFAGAPGSATNATSVRLAPGTSTADGGTYNCGLMAGAAMSDQISATQATTGGAYLVLSQ